ncbi:Na+/H+ antiporter NhaC family protein [uncultured Clostridium sp.]|uniref:Na+/H+ antiporter NhaC family protein n=1 Tax=uncultured Clostridium sp. TaxID=59620 RepID=UPI002672F0EE|nr:Na+/H+ antiporter NhaC family protein [uncultured Clostridium sp.]
MEYGVLSILPALIVIIFALLTKKTLEALLLGTLSTYIIMYGFGFGSKWSEAFFAAAGNPDNQWVLIVCGLFGSLIALLRKSKGTLGFAGKLERYCKTPKSTLITTWILGILIFVDEYLNIMTLGACMKNISDKKKVPRESLAYIIDSTGAPVCVLLPFSTWAIFYASVFGKEPAVAALNYGSDIATYLKVIPFTFYAWASVIIVPLFILGIIPKIGKMKDAYKRVETTGKVYGETSSKFNSDLLDEYANGEGKLIDFLLPMGVLIGMTIISEDLFISVIAALFVCLVLYVPRKKMTFDEFCDIYIRGFCDMVPTIAIVFMAFVMQQAANDIGLPNYVIETVAPYLNGDIFPAVSFIVVALLTFITGSNWGIPAVCVPIILPLGASLGANLVLVMAAVLSGGALGSHACFYSDATVLTSSSCSIDNMDHALSQIPYALIASAVSLAGFLICGFIL